VFAVAMLTHEVWEEVGDQGMVLHTCCLAGPIGDACRRMLSPSARLITTFEAGSHFEAMSIYHRLLYRETYTTDQAWDYEPYPDEWQTK
jgi:hypothetical protein